jgi:UDP-N-acetylglucosamine--N-acetylmuramyl-(pentapeptide) pyrophosphoryl-undecaprenol N-acetylglucosamine transferase
MTELALIMAGGTGGHVFPALAVAEYLRARDWRVVWLGTRSGLEARVVPAHGIPIEWVSVAGLRGKSWLAWLAAPFRLVFAWWQALGILRRHRPAVVLGVGGFVTGPGGVAARTLRRPLVIHEQNAIAGLTNRWLARIATDVLEAFPGSFGARAHARAIGNPVRSAIALIEAPESRMRARSGRARLLVVGGSLGARRLNTVVPRALTELAPAARPEVWHQSGERGLADAESAYRESGVEARVLPFIDDMAAAYSWCDLIICRAGALTISELAAAGLGAILVPFPFAVDDHQTANARFLVAAGAAVLIAEADLTPQRLAGEIASLAADRPRLLAMAQRARSLARPSATADLAEACIAAARGRPEARA